MELIVISRNTKWLAYALIIWYESIYKLILAHNLQISMYDCKLLRLQPGNMTASGNLATTSPFPREFIQIEGHWIVQGHFNWKPIPASFSTASLTYQVNQFFIYLYIPMSSFNSCTFLGYFVISSDSSKLWHQIKSNHW